MERKTVNRRTWLIAAAIVLAGVAISALILSGVFSGKNAAGAEEAPGAEYTVRFYDADGALLQEQTVQNGRAVLPPEASKAGMIFKGWSQALFHIEADTDAYAQFVPFDAEAKNVVSGGAIYADCAEPILVPIRLDGDVDCSGFTIEIGYDDSLLRYEAAEDALAGLRVSNEGGVLTLTYTGAALIEPTQLAVLRFSCRETGCWQTNLPLATKEIVAQRGGETVYTDSVAYDAEIYLMDNTKKE